MASFGILQPYNFYNQMFPSAQSIPEFTSLSYPINNFNSGSMPGLFDSYNQLNNLTNGNDFFSFLPSLQQFMDNMTSYFKQGGTNPNMINSTPNNNGNQVNQNQNSLLNKVSQEERDAVKGEDLTAVDEKGFPKYLISEGRDGQYHIYKQKKEGHGKAYKSVVKLPMGNNHLFVKDPKANIRTPGENKTSGSGGAGAGGSAAASASAGSGSAAAAAAASGGSASSSASSSSSLTFNPYTGYINYTTNSSAAAAAAGGGSGSEECIQEDCYENKGGGSTASPLILDANKDGKVSAQQGMGVDINGDGKADGAATNGDKMLAMGDLDGDGQITGKEVFGDKTIDPFTGQALNAKNGFEALNMVAKSAEQHTGIKCMDENGEVDLQKLKQALESSGKGSLGMISDNNTTQLESLGDAGKINSTNYMNQNQSGAVQHNQLGSYTDIYGNKQKVDDVWFSLA